MILLCFGTRPEWLKIKPIVGLMDRKDYKLLFTGQHPDLLKDVNVDYRIQVGQSENRLDQLIADCLTQFPAGEFDSVLVQGDTASAFACAIAAFNRGIKIYYLEAGLRSYDMNHPYPEEAYRQMIARIADVNFAPTELSASNLKNELVFGKVYVTGNTVLDNLVDRKKDCEYTDQVLITLHRRENHHWIDQWFREINDLAVQYSHIKFILPIHPNPNVQKHKHLLSHIEVVPPLEHGPLLDILVKCKTIITDSGGLQEEGSFFNKKVIVCRTTTERPEALDTGHLHICKSPNKLKELFGSIINNPYINNGCPYGDGASSQRVYNIFKSYEERDSNIQHDESKK
jgi:UDP-N-acetylglucosamine 2-epimerase (non-hydrolysing)